LIAERAVVGLHTFRQWSGSIAVLRGGIAVVERFPVVLHKKQMP